MKTKKIPFTIAEKTLQKVLLMLTQTDFADDVKKMRQEYLHSKVLLNNKKAKTDNLLKYTNKIEELRVKYGLSEPHFPPLAWLILFNDKEQKEINRMFNIYNHKVITDKHGGQTVYIPIYPETTINDIREILPKIKKIYEDISNDQTPKRIKRISSQNMSIVKMKSNGYTNRQILKEINDIVENKDIVDQSIIPRTLHKLRNCAKDKKNNNTI